MKLKPYFEEFLRDIMMYLEVVGDCWEVLLRIVKNAKFMFFAIVSLSISTMGLWIPVLFQLDVSGDNEKATEIGYDNIAIFMYVVSVLGTIAAEHFNNRKEDSATATTSFAMLIWFIAIVLSFWALKEPGSATWQLFISMWLTISLWLSYTIVKEDSKFTGAEKDNLSGTSSQRDSESIMAGQGVE